MNLSVKKGGAIDSSFATPDLRKIELLQAQFLTASGESRPFDLEQWPIMLFLKGFGFESVEFLNPSPLQVERWATRVASYQQSYIQDPENLRPEECIWNELDDDENKVVIQCSASEKARSQPDTSLARAPDVPPLAAPLGIDSETTKKFLNEIENQSAAEIVRRTASILKEFEDEAPTREPEIWSFLVGDVITVALEHRLVERARELMKLYFHDLPAFWTDAKRVVRLFAAYDPKAHEISAWAEIFSVFETKDLIKMIEEQIASPAGPQLIKLMHHRAQTRADELINFCFESDRSLQMTLLQWLTPHWRQKHYARILEHVKTLPDDEGLLRGWLMALLRSSSSDAVFDLQVFFPKKPLFSVIGTQPRVFVQKIILDLLMEHPSQNVQQFVRLIRKNLSGKLADQAEKILSQYKQGEWKK